MHSTARDMDKPHRWHRSKTIFTVGWFTHATSPQQKRTMQEFIQWIDEKCLESKMSTAEAYSFVYNKQVLIKTTAHEMLGGLSNDSFLRRQFEMAVRQAVMQSLHESDAKKNAKNWLPLLSSLDRSTLYEAECKVFRTRSGLGTLVDAIQEGLVMKQEIYSASSTYNTEFGETNVTHDHQEGYHQHVQPADQDFYFPTPPSSYDDQPEGYTTVPKSEARMSPEFQVGNTQGQGTVINYNSSESDSGDLVMSPQAELTMLKAYQNVSSRKLLQDFDAAAAKLPLGEGDESGEMKASPSINLLTRSEVIQTKTQRVGPAPMKAYLGRKRWTPAENKALLDGIKMLGHGNWKQIKNHFSAELQNRSTVQIKDKARSLKRKANASF